MNQWRWRAGVVAVGKDFGFEEFQHHAAMLVVRALEPVSLPPLAFVTAEVVNVESTIRLAFVVQFALQFDEALAAGVDGEPAEVRHDPATPQPLRHRARRAAAAEKIGNEVAFVAAGLDDAFEKCFGFLSRVIN